MKFFKALRIFFQLKWEEFINLLERNEESIVVFIAIIVTLFILGVFIFILYGLTKGWIWTYWLVALVLSTFCSWIIFSFFKELFLFVRSNWREAWERAK